ncbi:MAG: PrsW family glutamic-type intramembrane protease [Bacteroidales bacterium]|nr:PrsW family glutamic-type intramembrane protease [Bacteroidales bacterium]
MTFFLLALSVAPALAILMAVYFIDKYDREPIRLLLTSVMLGIVALIPAIIFELIFGFMDQHENIFLIFIYAVWVVGFAEEGCKFFFLRTVPYIRPDFNEPLDGIVYGLAISMGFAAVENIFYVLNGGVGLGLLRMFTAVPMHAVCGVVMGYYVGLAKFSSQGSRKLLSTGLLLAIAIHGLYDFFLIQQLWAGFAIFAFVVLIIGIAFGIKAIKIHRKDSPFKNPII